MNLQEATLGEISDKVSGIIQTGPFGSQLHESDYSQDGVPVVMPKNIIDGKISVDDIARVDETHATRLARHVLKTGDIVYGRRGDIGRRAIIQAEQEGWLCGTGCLRVSLGHEIIDPFYLYYYLGQRQVIDWIYNQAIGATMPNLNTSILRSVPIVFPDLTNQKTIANALKNYDDLIENNQRRIRILEDMAQSLYREWFVHFRFPGHEKIKMIESPLGPMPQEWNVATLGNYLSELQSGKRPKGGIDANERGVPSIGAENINGLGNYGYEKDKFVSEDFFESMNKGIVADQDVMLYKDGAYIGRGSYFRDNFPHSRCSINEHVFILRSIKPLTQNWLYFMISHPEMRSQIIGTNANAAQPGINQQSVRGLSFILPPEEVIQKFSEISEPILALLFNLAKRNRNLSLTRDMLLPKLISGEIDLSAANSQLEEAA